MSKADDILLGPRKACGDRPSKKQTDRNQNALTFVIEAARLCDDRHCEDVLVFDLRGLSDITDYILIVSGTSDRQIQAVAREVSDLAKAQFSIERFGSDIDATTWVVLDFVDAVVHFFEPTARAYYDLEMMWDDAPRVKWEREEERSAKGD